MKKIIDKGLNLLRKDGLVRVCEAGEKWTAKIGLICLYFVMPLIGIGICIEYDTFINRVFGGEAACVLVALACIPVCILLGYIADKMLEYVRPSIEQSKTNITNKGLFDIFALLLTITGIVLFTVGNIAMFTDNFVESLTYGIFGAVVCFYFSIMLLSPEKMLNVRAQNSASPAQSLISLVGFFIKAAYRAVPFAFGLLMVSTVISGIELLVDGSGYGVMNFANKFGEAAFLPLIAYLLFLLYYFVLDLCISFFRTADAAEKIADAKGTAKTK